MWTVLPIKIKLVLSSISPAGLITKKRTVQWPHLLVYAINCIPAAQVLYNACTRPFPLWC